MTFVVLVLAIVLTAMPMFGETQQRKKKAPTFWERLFKPQTTKTSIRRPKPHKHADKPRPQPTPTPVPTDSLAPSRAKDGSFIVDAQWMAYYWEQELAWDYPIPEDQDIKFVEGKYHVPPVVYRHYEDMVNASASRD